MAAAKEMSVDTAMAAVLSELDDIFTLAERPNKKEAQKAFLVVDWVWQESSLNTAIHRGEPQGQCHTITNLTGLPECYSSIRPAMI